MNQHRATPWILAATHCGLGLGLCLRGMNFNFEHGFTGWDWMWQVVPIGDLLEHPWESFWRQHSQPPGFSLWGLLWLHLFGVENFPASIQYGYILLGGLTVYATFRLMETLSGSRRLALCMGLFLTIHPALLLFEDYELYEMLVIALLMGSAVCLWRLLEAVWIKAGLHAGRWLAFYVLCLNLLVLVRSLYHWGFLWIALAFAWPAWRRIPWRIRWAWLILAIAAPGLVCAKNQSLYGFFGSSSWFGFGFYRCVARGFEYKELVELAKAGVIPEYVEKYQVFAHNISVYRPYGFNKTSDFPLLSHFDPVMRKPPASITDVAEWERKVGAQRLDLHNVNVPDISKAYARAAFELVRRHPGHYLKAIHLSYGMFCRPPSAFEHLGRARDKFIWWEPLTSVFLYGTWLTDAIQIPTRIEFGSLFYFGFPVLMAGALVWSWRRRQMKDAWDRAGGQGLARARATVVLYLVFVSVYVAAVGSLFESGENERFRFATEPMAMVLGVLLLRSVANRYRHWFKVELKRNKAGKPGEDSPGPNPAIPHKTPPAEPRSVA